MKGPDGAQTTGAAKAGLGDCVGNIYKVGDAEVQVLKVSETRSDGNQIQSVFVRVPARNAGHFAREQAEGIENWSKPTHGFDKDFQAISDEIDRRANRERLIQNATKKMKSLQGMVPKFLFEEEHALDLKQSHPVFLLQGGHLANQFRCIPEKGLWVHRNQVRQMTTVANPEDSFKDDALCVVSTLSSAKELVKTLRGDEGYVHKTLEEGVRRHFEENIARFFPRVEFKFDPCSVLPGFTFAE